MQYRDILKSGFDFKINDYKLLVPGYIFCGGYNPQESAKAKRESKKYNFCVTHGSRNLKFIRCKSKKHIHVKKKNIQIKNCENERKAFYGRFKLQFLCNR